MISSAVKGAHNHLRKGVVKTMITVKSMWKKVKIENGNLLVERILELALVN